MVNVTELNGVGWAHNKYVKTRNLTLDNLTIVLCVFKCSTNYWANTNQVGFYKVTRTEKGSIVLYFREISNNSIGTRAFAKHYFSLNC